MSVWPSLLLLVFCVLAFARLFVRRRIVARRRSAAETSAPAVVELPVFAVREGVLFPGMVSPFDVRRDRSLRAIAEARTNAPHLVLVAFQLDPSIEEPSLAELHPIGCVAALDNELPQLPNGQRVILHGQRRVLLRKVVSVSPTLRIEASPFPSRGPLTLQQQAQVAQLRARAKAVVRADPKIPKSAEALIDSIEDPESVVDLIAGNLDAPDEVKLRLLAADFEERLPLVLERLARSI